jgi:hypothetical protein
LVFIIDVGSAPSAAIVDGIDQLARTIEHDVSIASTAVISNPLFQITIDDVSNDDNDNVNIPSTLSFGTAELVFIIDTDAVPSTIIVANNNSVIPVYDIQSIASTAVISNPLFQITIDDVSNDENDNVNIPSTLSFGTTELVFIIDANAAPSTAIFSNTNSVIPVYDIQSIVSTAIVVNPLLQITIDDVNIPSTTLVAVPGAFQLGNGTITNFFVNTIGDLSTQQIAKYGNLTINSVPGNKIFDGIGTTFTTQLVPGSSIVVIDINGTNEEIPLFVNSISGNTALSVTSNVLYSNSSFAIVNNAIYLYS